MRTVQTTFQIKTVQLQRHPFYRHSNSQSYINKHHWFLLITSNSKVECARPWHSILIFRQLVLHDFHQVVPHSFSTAWQRLPVVLLHRRFTPAVLSFFPQENVMPQPQPQKKRRVYTIESDDEN